MARTPRPQKKSAAGPQKKGAPSPKAGATFNEAMKALESVEVTKHEIGRLNKDGTAHFDPKKLEDLKERLGNAAWSKVRFVALNAPFKRRTPVPPA